MQDLRRSESGQELRLSFYLRRKNLLRMSAGLGRDDEDLVLDKGGRRRQPRDRTGDGRS